MADTSIEWTTSYCCAKPVKGKAWNATTGCNDDVVSPGCERCYARRMARRLAGRYGYPRDEPFRVTLHPDRLDAPLHWRKPRRVFVDSMGDLFHEDVPDEFIAAVFGVMAVCPHTFIVLTKRAERLPRWFEWLGEQSRSNWPVQDVIHGWAYDALIHGIWGAPGRAPSRKRREPWPLPNVLLGVSIEDREQINRLDDLRHIPAAVRMVSFEPMLGPLAEHARSLEVALTRAGIGWAIAGAERGPKARPMNPDWARTARDACQLAGIPFFFKKSSPGQQTPSDLAIREWPEMTR